MREAEAALAARRVALLEAEEAAAIEYARFSAERPDAAPGTPNPLAVRQPRLEAARAALQREEAKLAQTNLALSRTRVESPFDGIVRDEWVDSGQIVAADQPVGKLFSTGAVEVVVPLSASLGVGILITTAILMVLVPALMAVYLRVNSSRVAATTPASA